MQTKLELYQLVVPLAGLGIWERNRTAGTIYCNQIVRQIFEVDPDYPLDTPDFLRFFRNAIEAEELLDGTDGERHARLEIITGKGNYKWVDLRANVRRDAQGNNFVYGSIEDITSDVELRRITQEKEQRFSNAFENAPIGMALVSLAGEWLRVNKSLCTLLGFEESELINKTFQELTHPDDLDADLMQLRSLIDGTIEKYSMEKRYFHKDGHTIWALLNVSLIRADTGLPLYFVSQIKDITQRRKNAEIIKAQNTRLLNFAHIVSHNLRSHAGNIHMLTDMIAAEQDPDERQLLVGMLGENADNLLETLAQLNEIVIMHNKGDQDRKALDLMYEISRVVQILGASILKENVDVQIDVPESMKVFFNPAYLESVLVNLFTNSIKYRHPDRQPSIRISASQDPTAVTIQYTDNGLGIDMKLHGHKLFGMYKTFHGNADARGLGLFLVKNQIEAMNGSITAESTPDVGTTFVIEVIK